MVKSGIRVIRSRVRGSSHMANDLPCQDAFAAKVLKYSDGKEALVMAVADGHGNSMHYMSEIGSRVAVTVAVEVVSELIRSVLKARKLELLFEEIQGKFGRTVKEQWEQRLIESPEEAARASSRGTGFNSVYYGTTLLVAVYVEGNLLIGRLGDGNAVVRTEDSSFILWEEEITLYANETDSLCTPFASQRIHWATVNSPKAVLLSTDGLVNSLGDYNQLNNIMAYFLDIEAKSNSEVASYNLEVFLRDCTRKGCGDDITVGIAVLQEDKL